MDLQKLGDTPIYIYNYGEIYCIHKQMLVQWLDMVSPHVLCVGFVDLCAYYS